MITRFEKVLVLPNKSSYKTVLNLADPSATVFDFD